MILNARRLTLSVNESGKDYVVGDIHGHVSQLHEQLNALGFDKSQDRLICVGDLIDRGPESIEALALLEEPWFFSVLGNHEYLMVSGMKYQNSKDRMIWLNHGGDWIMQTDSSQWQPWFEQIEALPLSIEVTNSEGVKYGIVHADFPAKHWDDFAGFDQDQLYRCIWSRSNFNSRAEHSIRGVDYLFHGHSITDFELKLGNRFYIEPGVFLGNEFIIRQL
ncbi:MAG: metallophosphoesterase [Thalassolituus sp.]